MSRLRPILALVAVLLGTSGAFAPVAGRDELVLTLDHIDVQQPVEQQSPNFREFNCPAFPNDPNCHPEEWVYNPFGEQSAEPCLWDVDDQIALHGTGVVRAGSTVSARVCHVADDGITSAQGKHPVQVLVRAPRTTLTVRLSNTVGREWTASPVDTGQDWTWTICHDDDTPGPYPEIAGSNGGHGIPIDFTVSITAGARDVRGVTGIVQVGGVNAGVWSIDCDSFWVE